MPESRFGLQPAYVYAQLPRTGVGNMLLVWAKAVAFATVNDLPLLPSTWTKLHIGPLLRRERDLRFYTRTFHRPSPLMSAKTALVLKRYQTLLDPEIAVLPARHGGVDRTVYLFHALPHWSDYFAGIRDHRTFIRDAMYSLLLPDRRQAVVNTPVPAIGVHIRLGDFLPAVPVGQRPSSEGIRIPMMYFTDMVRGIREVAGRELPVTIFSDGLDKDLEPMLRMPAVKRAANNPAIVDLLLLSRSKLIVTSAGSTFSAWSAFLADAPAIHHPDHPDHVHAISRPSGVNQQNFEGSVNAAPGLWPELLQKNIRDIA